MLKTNNILEITEMLRAARSLEQPAIILLGAGASRSAGIPTASDLIKEVRETYPNRVNMVSPNDPNEYGSIMSKLSPAERRNLIQSKLSKAKINWAHIGIAELMKHGYIDTILTTNFDNLAARACGVSGIHPATYDFSTSTVPSHDQLVKPAIIHLHGQGHGIVLLNSAKETERHAKKIAPLIRHAIETRPLLVLGYSGGADAVFKSIASGFKNNQRLYWISRSTSPIAQVRAFIDRHEHANYCGENDADSFSVEICNKLGIWPPPILSNPYGQLAQTLREFTPYPSHTEWDKYDATAAVLSEIEPLYEKRRRNDASRQSMQTLLLKQKYPQLIALAKSRYRQIKNDRQQRRFVVQACIEAGNKKYIAGRDAVKPMHALRHFRSAIAYYKDGLRYDPMHPPSLYNIAMSLQQIGLRSRSAATTEKYLRDAMDYYDLTLKAAPDHPRAIINKANAFNALGRRQLDKRKRIELYNSAIKLYQKSIRSNAKFEQGHHNLGKIYIELATLASGKRKTQLFDLAKRSLTKANALRKGCAAYNLACLHARTHDHRTARRFLIEAADTNYLPKREHIEGDADLDSIKHEAWFLEILDRSPLVGTGFWPA